ncbi:hypothetical protein C3L33_06018, partial [Rhododendron williamsianum]
MGTTRATAILVATAALLVAVVAAQAPAPQAPGPETSTGTGAPGPSTVAGGPGPSAGLDCMTYLYNMSDCLTYVVEGSNLTAPDKACCPELAGLVDSHPVCLCQLLGTNTSSYGFQINFQKALKLPSVCSTSPGASTPISGASGPGASTPKSGASGIANVSQLLGFAIAQEDGPLRLNAALADCPNRDESHLDKHSCLGSSEATRKLSERRIYSGSWDMTVRVWDRSLLKCMKVLRHSDWVWSLVPHDTTLATAAGSDVYVWDSNTGSHIAMFPWLVSASSDGRLSLIDVRKLLKVSRRSAIKTPKRAACQLIIYNLGSFENLRSGAALLTETANCLDAIWDFPLMASFVLLEAGHRLLLEVQTKKKM